MVPVKCRTGPLGTQPPFHSSNPGRAVSRGSSVLCSVCLALSWPFPSLPLHLPYKTVPKQLQALGIGLQGVSIPLGWPPRHEWQVSSSHGEKHYLLSRSETEVSGAHDKPSCCPLPPTSIRVPIDAVLLKCLCVSVKPHAMETSSDTEGFCTANPRLLGIRQWEPMTSQMNPSSRELVISHPMFSAQWWCCSPT